MGVWRRRGTNQSCMGRSLSTRRCTADTVLVTMAALGLLF